MKEIKEISNLLTRLYSIELVINHIQSFTNINALLDTNKEYRGKKKDYVYVQLKLENSIKYKQSHYYRSGINSLVSNIGKQISLTFATPFYRELLELEFYVKDNELEFLGLVHSLDLENSRRITEVKHLKNVTLLNLSRCDRILDFSELGSCNVQDLKLDYLESVPGIHKLGNIQTLSLRYTNVDQASINCLQNVQNLNLFGNHSINDVSVFCFMNTLDLSFCKSIVDVSQLGNVRKLTLKNCTGITNVNNLGNVRDLDLSYCINIVDVSFLGNVRKLILIGCSKISDVSCLGNVQILFLNQCTLVTNVDQLSNVKRLCLYGCIGITDVSHLVNVKYLNLQGCENIIDISMLINKVPILVTDDHYYRLCK
jgi:hypothetical protein